MKKTEEKDKEEELEEKIAEEVIEEPVEKIEKSEEELVEKIETKKEKEQIEKWIPISKLGKEVKSGKIKNFDEICNAGLKIFEPEIVDHLLKLESDLLKIGQAKGKFGGGKRRAWRQTQKKTAEGNVPSFSCMVVVGDRTGHVGIGYGKAKETLPAREKAMREAKLSLIAVERGCGSFDCSCDEKHSIPFKIEGKCGSVKIVLFPAPKGTGLAVEDDCKKILKLAGIKDIYSRTWGQTRTKINLAKACFDALQKLSLIKK
ncbi:30S ribosomal protein S5 [Candidatus Pacearchaeota archaeon]|nr:30S ribosomal protein S5 [Candidatus Pacearchaeota archaeon]